MEKAQQTLAAAKLQYQDQLAVYNDRTSAQQQLTDAENTLALAQQQAQNTVSNQQKIQADQQQIATDQAALAKDQSTLDEDQQSVPQVPVTSGQVQQAYQQYQSEEGLAINWQNGAYAGSNPYTTAAANAQNNYNLLNTEYQSQQKVAQDQQTIALDQKKLATDQATLAGDQSSSNYSDQQTQLQIQQDEQAVQAAEQAYNDRTGAKQTLDNAQIQIQQDQISLKSAEATLQADKSPADSTTIQSAQAAVANAKAALQSAEAQLQSAQLTEQETVLRAPIGGVITAVNAAAGENIGSSTVIATMEDNVKNDSQVQLSVSESQIEAVKPSDPIALTIDALPNVTFNGTVTQVYPVPTTTNNVTNYTVMATVDNSSGDLKPGMSANVEIQVADKQHVLTVPAISLVNFGSIEGVYVIGTQPKTGGMGGFGGAHNGSGRKGFTVGGAAGGSSGGASSGGSGTAANFAAIRASLPKGAYFQPVQVGLFGTNNVEITGGLSAGEKIMLVPPGSASSSSAFQSGNHGGMAIRAGKGG